MSKKVFLNKATKSGTKNGGKCKRIVTGNIVKDRLISPGFLLYLEIRYRCIVVVETVVEVLRLTHPQGPGPWIA